MQRTHLDTAQAADVLATSRAINAINWHGMRAHVLTCNTGRDLLLVQFDATADAFMVDGCVYDRDSGGSAHDSCQGGRRR